MRMEMTKLTSILIVCGIMGPLAFAQSESNELAPLTVNGSDTKDAEIDRIGGEEPASDKSEKPEKDPEEEAREKELKRLKNERDLIQARMALRSEKFKGSPRTHGYNACNIIMCFVGSMPAHCTRAALCTKASYNEMCSQRRCISEAVH